MKQGAEGSLESAKELLKEYILKCNKLYLFFSLVPSNLSSFPVDRG
jgi:hypothetical protein